MDRHVIIAVTGHRPQSLDGDFSGRSPLSCRLHERLCDAYRSLGATKVLTGMALGVDLLAAEAALTCEIPYVAVLPFPSQADRWHPDQRQRWLRLQALAAEVIVVNDDPYAVWKLHARNHYLVEHCDALVAVWDERKGSGTASAVARARRAGRLVHPINPLAEMV